MSAVDALENLIKLGTILSDAAANNKKDGKFDVVSFLNSDAAGEIRDTVNKIASELKTEDLESTIDAINKKQKDLLAGKKLSEQSPDKLIQYSALTDTKLLLETAKLKRAIEGDFYTWLLDGGLADIIKVAKVVIPLVV